MPLSFLHREGDFPDLLRAVADAQSIDPVLVEKDYWIMHCLNGLQQLGLTFELKGGTSLSKGLGMIDRFSEDIDIRIEPPSDMGVATNPKQQKRSHVEGRRAFYDWLAETIKIDGIIDVQRDAAFDDTPHYRSGGIRLIYDTQIGNLEGVREGILLEVGFDDVAPNTPHTITSWAYDFGVDKIEVIDNRAIDVPCYHPGYTLVEKFQTLSKKYRQQQETGDDPYEFLRHYYDVFCLLNVPEVRAFIGTEDYSAHKKRRFGAGDNPVLAENEAFLLTDPTIRQRYADAYRRTGALYYRPRPAFEEIMEAFAEALRIEGI